MTININIKANVNNVSLSGIYDILRMYTLTNHEIIEYKGYKFKIEVVINMSINYTITEIL